MTLRNERALILAASVNKLAEIEEYNLIISKQPEAYTYFNRGNIKSELGQQKQISKITIEPLRSILKMLWLTVIADLLNLN